MSDVTLRQFRIRKADAEDPQTWAMIVMMDSKCFGVEAPALTDNSGHWWIAYSGETPAAYGAVRQSFSSEYGAYLSRAGVLPEFRGCGLQKRLIRHRVAFARSQGYQFVVTDTANNPASGNSLIDCGFKLFTPEKYWAFSFSSYWRKFLLPKNKIQNEARK